MSSALHDVAIISILLSGLSSLTIIAEIVFGRRQKMMIMNFVWPITALWAGPLGLFAYWRFGRAHSKAGGPRQNGPHWKSVLVATTHCGAGCTLGDFVGEWTVFLGGVTIAGSVLWANYLFDFALAYLAGVVFQYYSIAPMRGLSGWDAIKAALKADTLSLIAFEVGMFAWMALSNLILFHPKLEPLQPEYWFMMQIAMVIGFGTAYPANWWLVRKGLKEAM